MREILSPALCLLEREILRFYRDRSRLIGALAPPVVFWFLIGSGLSGSFYAPGLPYGSNYLQFFFPGTIVLIVLFTSIFSMISVIEDRREGFLQGVLVAPVPRLSLVLGKILGGASLGFLQGLTFLILAPAAGLRLSLWALPLLLISLFLVALGLAGLGFLLAWRLDSTQGFHAVMNLFLIPMWLLSGALFPAVGVPLWLKVVMILNPITYSVASLQRGLLLHGASMPDPLLCLGVMTAFAALTLFLSVREASRPSSR